MHFNLNYHTILLTVGGSVSYGTATESSDLDLKGICIAPESTTLGFCKNFEQADGKDHIKSYFADLNEVQAECAVKNGYEGTVYDLRKFMTLASKGNPNILEVLFCDDSDVIINSPEGSFLRRNRDLFLSQAVRYSYAGFAMAQLKRIRGHKAWLLSPPTGKPDRHKFGLGENPSIPRHRRGEIEAEITKNVDRGFSREQTIKLIATFPAYKEDLETEGVIAALNAEYAFSKAMEEWTRYLEWRKNRNVSRGAAEALYGYDCKHAMHLVRLLRTGKELLTEGKLLVKRPDAEELLAVRAGEWSYERLIEWAEAQVAELDNWKGASPLPHSPDMNKLNELCVELHKSFYRRGP